MVAPERPLFHGVEKSRATRRGANSALRLRTRARYLWSCRIGDERTTALADPCCRPLALVVVAARRAHPPPAPIFPSRTRCDALDGEPATDDRTPCATHHFGDVLTVVGGSSVLASMPIRYGSARRPIAKDGDPPQWPRGSLPTATGRQSAHDRRGGAVSVAVHSNRDLSPHTIAGPGLPPDTRHRRRSHRLVSQHGTRSASVLLPVRATLAGAARPSDIGDCHGGDSQGRILPPPTTPIRGRRGPGRDEFVARACSIRSSIGYFRRARGPCQRELPSRVKAATDVDRSRDRLVFEDDHGTIVLDFKTDRELSVDLDRYRRQLAVYCQAIKQIKGGTVKGLLVRV